MQLLLNALIAGSLAALIAGGLALVYGVLGVFNLALGQTALVGGYVTWWLIQIAGLPLMIAIPGGLLAGMLTAWLTFELCVGPFYKHHRFLPIVTTIAWSMILDAVILLGFEERPKSILPGAKHMLPIGDLTLSQEQLMLIVATVLIMAIFAWVLHATPFGRRVRATVQHSDAARSLGISASVLHRVLFVGSGMLAAAGGIFIGIDQALTPTFGFPLTIKAYAAVIAGGKGNVWGAIVGAYLIALVEQFAIGVPWWNGQYLSSGYQSAIGLFFIIIFLLLRPQGLFGSRIRTA